MVKLSVNTQFMVFSVTYYLKLCNATSLLHYRRFLPNKDGIGIYRPNNQLDLCLKELKSIVTCYSTM